MRGEPDAQNGATEFPHPTSQDLRATTIRCRPPLRAAQAVATNGRGRRTRPRNQL